MCFDTTEAKEEFIYKRNYSGNSIETFKLKLHKVNWNEIKQSNNTICTSLYEECFPKFKIRLNQRKNLSPWITKGIKKSSERKQKLYEKFLKKRNAFNETAYRPYQSLFEKENIKKRWTVIKEIIGTEKIVKNQIFPGNLRLVTK